MLQKSFLDWTANLFDWQRDALRRIASKPELSDADKAAVFARVRHACGIPGDGDVDCEPFATEHVPAAAEDIPKTILCALGPTKHVNRLAEGQTLRFGLSGITLIYGENGTGKSGYCRILKKLCDARGAERLLGNIFASGAAGSVEAQVHFLIDGDSTLQVCDWVDGQTPPDSLARLHVFDARNARLYVDEKNQVEYVPLEIDLLERLASLFTELEEKVKKERQGLEARIKRSAFSGYNVGTEVSALLGKLALSAPLPEADSIEALAQWSDAPEQELAGLRSALSQDPKMLADRYRATAKLLRILGGEMGGIFAALDSAAIETLRAKIVHASTASRTAALAAAERFKSEPLTIGDLQSWQQMYRYAKEYSQHVYPDVPPPATRAGDRCVLCQQELSEDARARLMRFEDLVSDRAARDAEAAQRDVNDTVTTLRSLHIRRSSDVSALLREYRDMDTDSALLADKITSFFESAMLQREAAVRAGFDGKEALTGVEPFAIAEIDAAVEVLERREQDLGGKGDDPAEKANKSARIKELEDRKLLSVSLPSVLSRLHDLHLHNKLAACQNALNTRKISLQVTALRQTLITDELKQSIDTELQKLRLNHIPFHVKEESRRGESRLEVALNSKQPAMKRDVLSEGEQRALALACFFADVVSDPMQHGLILDDPVSSLDHKRIELVAQRLVEVAAHGRQVIVFTHNLQFYHEVRTRAGAHPSPVPLIAHVIDQNMSEGAGIIGHDDVPWIGKKVSERITYMRNLVAALDGSSDCQGDEYRRKVTDFYTHLRETWERLVEEKLLGGVVQRYCSEVKTQSLKQVVVDNEDYRTIFIAMKRASTWSGHDMSIGRAASLPAPVDMRTDLCAIEEYCKTLKGRARATESERKKLEEPPVANVMQAATTVGPTH